MNHLCIGTMSGTSMDGIDVAAIETDGEYQINFLEHHSLNYTPKQQLLFRALARAVHEQQGDLKKTADSFAQNLPRILSDLGHNEKISEAVSVESIIKTSTLLHLEAIQTLLKKLKNPAIRVIGYHGQTLYHNPKQKISLQVGDGALLANVLKIPVVDQFRLNDIQGGGQGAPLAPLYHHALAARDGTEIPMVIVNCGGIANVSLIQSNSVDDLRGFDTGPGNVLIDRFVQQHHAGESMDKDGKYGKQGQVNAAVLELLWQKSCGSYYKSAPPKSLDTHDLVLIPELNSIPFNDACRTLEAFTAKTIVQSVRENSKNAFPKKWILAGGGWYNPIILQHLREEIMAVSGPSVSIQMADEIGWHGQLLEAQMFAYYAIRHILKKPISFPHLTQVDMPTVGGQYRAPE